MELLGEKRIIKKEDIRPEDFISIYVNRKRIITRYYTFFFFANEERETRARVRCPGWVVVRFTHGIISTARRWFDRYRGRRAVDNVEICIVGTNAIYLFRDR